MDPYYRLQNEQLFKKLTKNITQIDVFNFYDGGQVCIDFLNKLNELFKLGYFPHNHLQQILPIVENIVENINKKQEEIFNINYPTLCNIEMALDPLDKYIDNMTYGSMALVSKDHYTMINNKLGESRITECIYEHFIHHPVYTDQYKIIKLKVGDTIFNYNMPLNIIALKNLRKLIGPELYFEKYGEVFFRSDLTYIVKILNEKNICIKLESPHTVCMICEEIKTINDPHANCMKNYKKKFAHTSKTRNFNTHIHNIYEQCDNDINININTDHLLCNCVRTAKMEVSLKYLHKELVEYCKINYTKYFTINNIFNPNLKWCNGGKQCRDCGLMTQYNYGKAWDIYDHIKNITDKTLVPDYIDDKTCFYNSKTPMNKLISSICNAFVLPHKYIGKEIRSCTPCYTCHKPFFLHGFR